MQNIEGQTFLEVTKGKFPSQYFNNISRLGTRAGRSAPVAGTVGESFLLRCLLEKETFEFYLVREILRGKQPCCVKAPGI